MASQTTATTGAAAAVWKVQMLTFGVFDLAAILIKHIEIHTEANSSDFTHLSRVLYSVGVRQNKLRKYSVCKALIFQMLSFRAVSFYHSRNSSKTRAYWFRASKFIWFWENKAETILSLIYVWLNFKKCWKTHSV